MNLGFGELVLIAVIALIFLGPEKFPDFAKLFVRAARDLRSYVDDVKSEVTKEILPVKGELQELSRMDPETYINKLVDSDDDRPEATPASSTAAYDNTAGSDAPVQEETTASDGYPVEPANDAGVPAEEKGAGETGAVEQAPETDPVHPPERLDG